MTSVYDQKTATYMYGREQYAEGKALGIEIGLTEGVLKLLRKQVINLSVAAKELNMSEKEVLKLVKKV